MSPPAAPDPAPAGPAPTGSDREPRPATRPEPCPEPIRTLLETASACRPVEEVTAPVSLLKETGGLASPGHDALRTAAVTRPVDGVRHMVTLLGEHPLEEAEAVITLRAAAVGRPIEDVAPLARVLGPDGAPPAERPPARTSLPPPQEPPAPAPEPVRAPAAPPPAAVSAQAPSEAETVPAPARGGSALRNLPRWPAAAALFLCGVLHLPGDLARPPAPESLAPLAGSLLCPVLGALLAVRGTPAVWRTAAVAALAAVTLHIVGGPVFFDPLDGALGRPYAWSGVTAVLCAGAAAVQGGLDLTYGRPPPGAEGCP